MPLHVEVLRDGKPREDIVWDYVTLSCIYTAAHIEGDPKAEYDDGKTFGALEGTGKFVDFSMSPIYYLATKAALVRKGIQKMKRDHTFVVSKDGSETFELKAGDVINAYRQSK